MKMNLPRTFSIFALLFLALALIAGCSTTPKVDWNTRVNSGYTFDQAVTELGPPDKQAKLSDGKTVAEWVKRSNGGGGLSIGTGFYSGGVGVGVAQGVGSGSKDKVLKLIFSPENKLVSWSKNY